jgi:endonuclease YncB( thermonuclease family)
MWDKRAALVRVKDGDTLVALLDQGFRDTKEVDVRLYGVFCPERGQDGYSECKQFTQAWIEHEEQMAGTKWPFVVTTMRMKTVDREQTTLERYVATVTSLDGTRNLNLEVEAFRESKGYPPGAGWTGA